MGIEPPGELVTLDDALSITPWPLTLPPLIEKQPVLPGRLKKNLGCQQEKNIAIAI